MEGLEIELDRTVLDEIGDTIVHLLRNSIDHGIEPPEARVAAGKSEEGRVRLAASREREYVEIEVSDDGHGIDVERVWAKAVECGIVSASERAAYDDRDVLLLTCVPGFSTAKQATRVSGRGVGMDVVKDRVEGLGGTLQIESAPSGTRFVLRLPGTLAIVQALLIRSSQETLAIPLSAVEEVHATEGLTLDTIDGAPVVIMPDGRVTPLRRLDSLLFAENPPPAANSGGSVLIVRVGGEAHALHVDALEGRSEIVVKPLTELLRRTKGFSGATVTGDGRVLLVIDPRTIFEAEEV
jgi:two-component system chemotaxis sensor kinase CheA